MKIAFIVRRLNIKGGTQRQALSLAREMKRLGHEIKVYTFHYSKEKCYEDLLADLEVVSLPESALRKTARLPGYLNFFKEFLAENRTAKSLALLIDRDTEVLHPHDQASYKVACYFKKCVNKIPSVWQMNDPPTKLCGFWRESQIRKNLRISPLKNFFYWLFEKYEVAEFLKKQDVITVLDGLDKKMVRRFYGLEALILRSGLDLEKFKFVQREIISGKKIKIFMAGILFPHRRFEDVIGAAKILKRRGFEFSIEIAGDIGADSHYYNQLQGLANRLGVHDKIKFLGRISDLELLNKYQMSDIFIFPSYMQSWGLAVFEAMACGLPAIVSRGAGAHEVLTDRQNALLVDPLAPGQIALSVEELVKNGDLYVKISKEGRAFVEKNISWPIMAGKLIEIFRQLLKEYEIAKN